MKTLIIVRHAKTKELSSDGLDFNRALTTSGKRDAELRGIQIHALQPQPDILLCSNALRARQTAACINEVTRIPDADIRFDDDLYLANEAQLCDAVHGVSDNYSSLLLIGHNPGLIDFVNYLSPDTLNSLPTSGAVQLGLNIDHWPELFEGCGVVRSIVLPEH